MSRNVYPGEQSYLFDSLVCLTFEIDQVTFTFLHYVVLEYNE